MLRMEWNGGGRGQGLLAIGGRVNYLHGPRVPYSYATAHGAGLPISQGRFEEPVRLCIYILIVIIAIHILHRTVDTRKMVANQY